MDDSGFSLSVHAFSRAVLPSTCTESVTPVLVDRSSSKKQIILPLKQTASWWSVLEKRNDFHSLLLISCKGWVNAVYT